MRVLKQIICRILFLFGFDRLYRLFKRGRRGHAVCVLSLHRVIDDNEENSDFRENYLTFSKFKRRVRFIKERYGFFALSRLAAAADDSMPDGIILTCDDGYRDVYTRVYPLMKEEGLPFTVFLTSSWVGREGMLTREDIGVMAKDPLVEWGAHGVSHIPLTDLPVDKAEEEIVESKKRIEEMVGRSVNLFCYPDGMFNDEIRKMLSRHGFTVACATGRKLNCGSIDKFELKRIPFENEPVSRFAFRIAGLV